MATSSKRRSSKPSPLLYASSDGSADMLYFSRFFAPDPFLAFGAKAKKIGVVSSLEYSRARKESALDEVHCLQEILKVLRKRNPKAGLVDVIRRMRRHYGISSFVVPRDFPSWLYEKLKQGGIRVEVREEPLFSQRIKKDEKEQRALREGNRASEAGLREVERILRASRIRNGKITYQGRLLTSEYLRKAVLRACVEAGAGTAVSIVAGGNQACDPHCIGFGPLAAHRLIIVDIFPRIAKTGYFGDMTRTFLKGRPSDAQRNLVAAVREANRLAIRTVKAGVTGEKIDSVVRAFFEREGFKTGFEKDVYTGFFHGLGHGLGLEVHEAPFLGKGSGKLRNGMVVTIEPGLYYPGVGGCRFEDVVCVTREGCRMLSKYPYRWHIP